MFEGKLPQASQLRPLEDELGDAARLRALSWDDLVARLSAARELRGALRASGELGEASFRSGAARRPVAPWNGKPAVNPDSSSNGKGRRATASGVGSLPELEVPAAPRGHK